MLSLSRVQELGKMCKDLHEQCQAILSERTRESIFTSPQSKEHIYNVIAPKTPDDFYKFRFMEKYVELCRDYRTSEYYIHAEHFTPVSQDLVKLRYEKSAYWLNSKDYGFAVQVFLKFCQDLLHQVQGSNPQLFYVY